MPDIPKCGNFLAGSCERSDTYVEAERHDAFVIRCRTCKGVNIWPHDQSERAARYQAFLKRKADEEQLQRASERKREYSI